MHAGLQAVQRIMQRVDQVTVGLRIQLRDYRKRVGISTSEVVRTAARKAA